MPTNFPDHDKGIREVANLFSIKQTIEQEAFHAPVQTNIEFHPREEKRVTPAPENVSVTFGIPMSTERFIPGESRLEIPDTPYIFKASELVTLNNLSSRDMIMRNVMVMLSHAGRDQNDQWIFGDGQRVADVVEAYQAYARKNDLPPLEFILACNKETNSEAVEQGVLVQDTTVEDNVVQCVGDIMGLRRIGDMQIPENGTVSLFVTPKKGEFWGVENLIKKKRALGDAD